jgi:hypothetical protein
MTLLLSYAASAPSNSKTKLRPAVPSRDEAPTLGLSSNKNFITSNAVEAILSKPGKVPQEPFQWTTRPGYGEVPMYLKKNKLTVMREKESFEAYVKMRTQPVRRQSCMVMATCSCLESVWEGNNGSVRVQCIRAL